MLNMSAHSILKAGIPLPSTVDRMLTTHIPPWQTFDRPVKPGLLYSITRRIEDVASNLLSKKLQPKKKGIEIVIGMVTLSETNTAPENGCLEYWFPFGMAFFQGL